MPFDGKTGDGRYDALDKIDRVIGLLSRKERWCKQQLRTRDGRRCIQGAMMEADATIVLKQPILLAIRQITRRDYARIEMFNDQPLTTHTLVLQVLHQARQNILDGVIERPLLRAASARPSGEGGMRRTLALLRRCFA